ncbi:MAG: hypothetical protein IKW56_02215, partial [Methanocorpusculum sp.]|nr:hypothetical protein [Methanocorpusculum sp.]
ISVPESERSDENGMVILSRVNACAPPPFLYSKAGVGDKASAPSMQAKSQRLVGMSRRRRSGSDFFSPTEIQQKSINRFIYLKKKNHHEKSDCPPRISRVD